MHKLVFDIETKNSFTDAGSRDPAALELSVVSIYDFETGEEVYRIFTGTGKRYNNNWAPITLAPDGTAYIGVLNGIVQVRDND